MAYSQWGEDIFLYDNYFGDIQNGTFVELGALDGVLYSNTKFFEDTLNWSGILIEPHPLKFVSLQHNRPRCMLFNNLVSCHSEELEFKYFVDGLAAVSGVENTLSQHHFDTYYNRDIYSHILQSNMRIKPKSLTDIIKSTDITHINFLSLDVEGHEYEVLMSWDFSIPIDLILIETLGVDPARDELSRQILLRNGYVLDNIFSYNEIYILKNLKLY
jgi:FkbM family methyltransferase